LRTAGTLRSQGIAPVHCYYSPFRHPPAFQPISRIDAGYWAFRSPGISPGAGRASPVARYILAAMPSLLPRWSGADASASLACPCCLRPQIKGSTSRFLLLRDYTCVHFRYRLVARSPSRGWFYDELQRFGLPPPCRRCFIAPGFYHGGLFLPQDVSAFSGRTICLA
jgi:hypothetical protein